MTTGEQVDRAARLIYQLRHPGGDPIGGTFAGPSWAEIEMRDAQATARALAEAGLLAPAPLREEWGVRWDDHDIWGDMYNTSHEAETGAGDEGTPVHRYVTDWEKA